MVLSETARQALEQAFARDHERCRRRKVLRTRIDLVVERAPVGSRLRRLPESLVDPVYRDLDALRTVGEPHANRVPGLEAQPRRRSVSATQTPSPRRPRTRSDVRQDVRAREKAGLAWLGLPACLLDRDRGAEQGQDPVAEIRDVSEVLPQDLILLLVADRLGIRPKRPAGPRTGPPGRSWLRPRRPSSPPGRLQAPNARPKR